MIFALIIPTGTISNFTLKEEKKYLIHRPYFSEDEEEREADLPDRWKKKVPNIPHTQFETLFELKKVLTPENFKILVFNVSIGNQIIVRGDSKPLVVSILSLLQVWFTQLALPFFFDCFFFFIVPSFLHSRPSYLLTAATFWNMKKHTKNHINAIFLE